MQLRSHAARSYLLLGMIALTFATISISGSGSARAVPPGSAPKSTAPATDVTTSCPHPGTLSAPSTQVVDEPGEPAGTTMQATIYTTSNGTDTAQQRIPPTGWKPATATQFELTYFNIPPRPAATDPTYAAWKDEWVDHYSGIEPATLCQRIGSGSAGNPWDGQINRNPWAGVISTAAPITETYGSTEWNPGTPCAAQPDGYTNWVGIGGVGLDHGLLQNGFWSSHQTGSSNLFYEAIITGTTSLDTTPVPLQVANMNRYDLFNISTTYSQAAKTVTFGWHDLTTGAVASFGPYDGFYVNGTRYALSFWYDPSTGEAIDEHQYAHMRNFGTDVWSNVQVRTNGGSLQLIRNVAHYGAYSTNGSTGFAYVGSGGGGGSFNDIWNSC